MTDARWQQSDAARAQPGLSTPGEVDYRLATDGGQAVPGPVPTVPHQSVAHLLVRALRTSARKAGLGAHGTVLLQLGPDRLLVPDLVVARVDRVAALAEAADTVLVGEITRPGTGYAGTPARIEQYAAAGIPWFLLTQPESPEYRAIGVQLFRLRDGRYLQHTSAAPGQLLVCKEPFPFRLRTTDLVVF